MCHCATRYVALSVLGAAGEVLDDPPIAIARLGVHALVGLDRVLPKHSLDGTGLFNEVLPGNGGYGR